MGRKLAEIFGNFGDYWEEITNDDQARWVRCYFGHRGGSKISGKGVHMYKGIGVRIADLSHFY